MGYRIEYDGRAGKYEVHAERKLFPVLLMCSAALILVAMFLWPQGVQALRSILIPGEDAVTLAAFQNLTADLRSGASVGDAVEAFCRFVIHGK